MFGFKKKAVPVATSPEWDLDETDEEEIEPRPDLFWSYSEKGQPGKLVHFFRPGEPNRRHVVTQIVASLKRGGVQLLTVQDEGHMALQTYVHGSLALSNDLPLRVNKALQVTLNCFEDDDNVAALTVWGYTEDKLSDEDDVLP